MPNKSYSFLGIALVFGFGVLTAGKEVLAANVIQSLPVFHLLFYSFLITLIVSSLFNRIGYKGYASNLKAELKPIVLLNVATALSWVGFFFSIKHLEPAIAAAIVTSVGPLMAIFNDSILRKKQKIYLADLLTSITIGGCVVWLAWVSGSGGSGVGKHSLMATLFALMLAITVGFSFSFSSVYAKKLNDKGWSPFRIMATRYYLLLFVAALFSLWSGGLISSLKSYWGVISLIAFLGVLVPLYMLQFGIHKCEPFIVSLVIALGPAFTLLFESFDQRISWSEQTGIGIGALITCTLMGIVIKSRRESRLYVQ